MNSFPEFCREFVSLLMSYSRETAIGFVNHQFETVAHAPDEVLRGEAMAAEELELDCEAAGLQIRR